MLWQSIKCLEVSGPLFLLDVSCASAIKDIRDSIEFVEAYENVVLAFDNDKAGQDAAKKIARILKPNKTKITFFSHRL